LDLGWIQISNMKPESE